MIGEIISFPGITIPDGFLLCDGSAVSRSEYAALFEVVGTTYGIGDGSTTFNLPDLTDRIPLGVNSHYSIGSKGGAAEVGLDLSSIPSHTHNIPAHTHRSTISATMPSLPHTITQATFSYTRLNATANVGEPSSRKSYSRRTNASMSRATSVAIADHPATACTMSGSITDCPSFDTEATGSGDAHNNMMPYIALVYLIQAEPDTPPGPVIPSMVLFNGALPVGPSGAYIAGRK